MAKQHKSYKIVVPIEELKRQIDERNSHNFDSISEVPTVGVHSTWSKYPCDKEKTCKDTYCDGQVLVKFKDDINGFLLALWAVNRKRKTYILPDHHFRELLKEGNFIECQREQVWY